jgi:hypothetical protein
MSTCDLSLNLRFSLGTLFPDMTKEIPTVVDNLHSQGKISSRLLGLYLEPYSPTNNKTGILTYGMPALVTTVQLTHHN